MGYTNYYGKGRSRAAADFEYKGKYWSVIHGFGTYGGWNSICDDSGLLEIWDGNEGPIGFLTAEEAFGIITEGE